MYVGKLRGIEIITGDTYLIDNERFILKEVIENHCERPTYVFKNPNGFFEENLLYSEGSLLLKIYGGKFKKIELNDSLISYDTLDALKYSCLGFINSETEMPRYDVRKLELGGTPNLQVHFNDKKKATTIIKGNKVVVVRTKKGEKYNRRIGFLEAYFELMSGMSKTQKSKYLDEITGEK